MAFGERGSPFLGELTGKAVQAALLGIDTVVSPVLPFALWAMLAARPPPASFSGPLRNAPCPCGSGR